VKRRYTVKVEYEVTFDEKMAKPGEATKFLREQLESGFAHEGFSTGLGGIFFTSKGKPTVKVLR
jgi:hypothetical protein